MKEVKTRDTKDEEVGRPSDSQHQSQRDVRAMIKEAWDEGKNVSYVEEEEKGLRRRGAIRGRSESSSSDRSESRPSLEVPPQNEEKKDTRSLRRRGAIRGRSESRSPSDAQLREEAREKIMDNLRSQSNVDRAAHKITVYEDNMDGAGHNVIVYEGVKFSE